VERGMPGFTTPEIKGKWSLRASITGELIFQDVIIPEENILPEARGLKAPLSCLSTARYGISWGALGAAMDCLHHALEYSKERMQFGKPLAAFQLTQKKLAEMLTDITQAQLLALQVGKLYNEGKVTPAHISMAKRNNVEMALRTARECRQLCGAMGISGELPFMRHAMNLESVITYEGTHEVHLLITGMDLTGINAFS
jgi:glutaryl-CoA dehydrogenase